MEEGAGESVLYLPLSLRVSSPVYRCVVTTPCVCMKDKHAHPYTLTHTHTHSLTHSHSLTLTLTNTHTHSPTPTLSDTQTLTLSITYTHTHTLTTHIHPHTLTRTLTHSYTFTHSTLAPEYMRDIHQGRTNVRTLCSTVFSQLAVPQSRLKGFGDRAFGIAAQKLWNALPVYITDCKSIGAFKKGLQTHLFETASGVTYFPVDLS